MREKLIELLMQAKIGWTKAELVDYLIANGVTIPMRCKDCKSFTYDGYHKHYYCSRAKGLRYAILPDDFCPYGERREGE